MKSCKTKFLEKSILGRETNLDDPEEVILKCIKLAYRDMLTAGRYYISKDMDSRCDKLKLILEKNSYVYSHNIIEETLSIFGNEEKIGTGNEYVTRYGLTQKLVNMTYKYLYVFSEYTRKDIDFSDCDCPLDSVILKKLKFKGHVWSKMTKAEYEQCQQMIADNLKEKDLDTEIMLIGNLAFDFQNW